MATDTLSLVSFQHVSVQTLHWVQPSVWKQRYELRTGESLVAVMRNIGFWGTSIIVESAQGRWRFDRSGFWRRHVRVSDMATGTELAVLTAKFLGDVLTLPDGRQYHWRSTIFWGNAWAFTDDSGADVAHFKIGGFFKPSSTISISPTAKNPPTFLLLVVGWYLYIVHMRDSAAVVAATTAC